MRFKMPIAITTKCSTTAATRTKFTLAAVGLLTSCWGRNNATLDAEGGSVMMPPHIATRVPSGPPRNLLWTVDQFHYLGDLGMFEGRRAWLVDGVIVEEG